MAFHHVEGRLTCDGVALDDIARAAGTPVHVYSAATIVDRYHALDHAIGEYPHRLHYAMKANSTLAIVRLMRDLGASVDANSGGEIEVAVRAGFAPPDIVFTGVGKTGAELDLAVGLNLSAINVESSGEMERIAARAQARNTRARVAVRINPDVDAGSHPHISTGLLDTKFGMTVGDAAAMIRTMARHPHLRVVGLHVHIGSQVTTVEPLTRAAETISQLARTLAGEGIQLEHVDLGGGLGVAYEPDQKILSVEEYAAAILPAIRSSGLKLLLEPGRWIVGPAGVLVTAVVDLKPKPAGGCFVIVDAGLTDLLRPALYGAWHGIEAVAPRPGQSIQADIVGPVCETSDTLGRGRTLPPTRVGDVLAIRDTGAYGAVMASNYNRRPIASEVLVESGEWRTIRHRQTIDDMLQWDA
ncbi:MAG TPA: diaminopimelate decarboxylase [Vicinamibacterales bacterium]|nr:diaminopimelate decarboxylase [Vicinamibacterales bacterium]